LKSEIVRFHCGSEIVQAKVSNFGLKVEHLPFFSLAGHDGGGQIEGVNNFLELLCLDVSDSLFQISLELSLPLDPFGLILSSSDSVLLLFEFQLLDLRFEIYTLGFGLGLIFSESGRFIGS